MISRRCVASSLRPASSVAPSTFASGLFALGIIGTGLLGVPVLAGSAAFAVAETRGWKEGLEYKPQDPNARNMQAYFGNDPSQYANRSAITHINDGAKVPVFLVVTEYDNPGLDVSGAELFAALCKRDKACPRFTRLQWHNHLSEVVSFNTRDEKLGREILDFIHRDR